MLRLDDGRLVVALCALAGCLGCPQKPSVEIMGIRGKEVTLVPELNGTLTEITWKKTEDIVAEWDGGYWFAPHLEGRAKLNQTSGSLTLEKLQKTDMAKYRAEAFVERAMQCTFFSVQILEPPNPPHLNCTNVGDRIWVSCELDAQDVAQKINPTYKWRYEKSNKEIPGDPSVYLPENDVDLLENITCVISVYSANASSSIPLKSCISTGAASPRHYWILLSIAVVLTASLGAFCLWKNGFFRRQGRSQDCEGRAGADGSPSEGQHLCKELSGNLAENSREGGTGVDGTPSEGEHLLKEHSRNLEENSRKGGTATNGTLSEGEHLHEEHSENLAENIKVGGTGANGTPSEGQHPCEEHSGNLEEDIRDGPSDPGTRASGQEGAL